MLKYCSWCFNPEILTVVDTEGEEIEEGDFIVISNREDWVKEKQENHGGWVPAMQKVFFFLLHIWEQTGTQIFLCMTEQGPIQDLVKGGA